MNIDFFVKQIEITNFRGIQHLVLDFDAAQPTIILGPNNAGKTTLLDALGLALGSGKFLSYELCDEDFWKDGAGTKVDEFTIKVLFESKGGCDLPAVKGGVGDPVDVHGILVTANRGDYIQRQLLDKTGSVFTLTNSTPISKGGKDKYKGSGLGGSRRYARANDIQQHLPEVWYLDPKNLHNSLYEWKTGPLHRLLKLYKEQLLTEKWTIDAKHAMPDSLHTAHAFIRDKALKTPYWINQVAPKINEKFKDYLGQTSNVSVDTGLSPIDEWIMSQLLVQVVPAVGYPQMSMQRLGDGWQSIMRLVALEVVSELNTSARKVMLLMEEPETYLHPHLRRKLRKVLGQLQAAGNQIFVATHSAELISFIENATIIRFTRTNTGTQKYIYSTATVDQAVKDDERLNEHGAHEIVFANKVILTEGKDDQFAVRLALTAKGIDTDTEGVSIVNCHSVGNIPAYADLCSKLGIPWYAIHDGDMVSGVRKKNTQDTLNKLTASQSTRDQISEWDNELEDVVGFRALVGLGKATPEWTDAIYGGYTWAQYVSDTNLAKFVPVIDSVATWIN